MTDLESAAAEIVRDILSAVDVYVDGSTELPLNSEAEFAARIVALAQDYHASTTEALRRQLHEARKGDPLRRAWGIQSPPAVRREHSPL